MDLSKLNVAQLEELQKLIPTELRRRHVAEKAVLIRELSAIAAARGYTLADLMGNEAKMAKNAGPRKPVAAKYRHPQDPRLTWAGRGKQPKWVVEHLAKGKTLESLEICAAKGASTRR